MPTKTECARHVANTPTKQSSDSFAESLRALVEQAHEEGVTSFYALADYLTERGIRTAAGRQFWSHDAAGRLLRRLRRLDASKHRSA